MSAPTGDPATSSGPKPDSSLDQQHEPDAQEVREEEQERLMRDD